MQQLCVELTRVDLLSDSTDGKQADKLLCFRHSPWPEAALFSKKKNPFAGKTPKELQDSTRGPPGAQVQL